VYLLLPSQGSTCAKRRSSFAVCWDGKINGNWSSDIRESAKNFESLLWHSGPDFPIAWRLSCGRKQEYRGSSTEGGELRVKVISPSKSGKPNPTTRRPILQGQKPGDHLMVKRHGNSICFKRRIHCSALPYATKQNEKPDVSLSFYLLR
jgi:hypothetical protein